jgi:hypothetical protein
MVSQDSLLVTLVKLVDRLPMPALPMKRGRGHPKVYTDRLFLMALVIMIVRHLHNVHELLTVLAQPTEEMRQLREVPSRARPCSIASHLGTALKSHSQDLACSDWLSRSSSDRADRAMDHVWTSSCHR